MRESGNNVSSLSSRIAALADTGLESTASKQIEEGAREQFIRRATQGREPSAGIWHRMKRGHIAMLGAGAILLTGTAVAATMPWSPTIGSPQLGHPTAAASAPSGATVANLAVLRRPQSESDRGPRSAAMLKTLGAELVSGVRLPTVRLLGTSASGATFLFSTESAGMGEATRRDVLCFVTSTDVATRPIPSVGSAYGRVCGNEVDIASGRLIGMWPQAGGKIRVSGLVPDGVVSVAVPVNDERRIVAAVANNSFDAVATGQPGDYDAEAIQMLDAGGRDLRVRSPAG